MLGNIVVLKEMLASKEIDSLSSFLYSFKNYLEYLQYQILFLAFNEFISQVPSTSSAHLNIKVSSTESKR